MVDCLYIKYIYEYAVKPCLPYYNEKTERGLVVRKEINLAVKCVDTGIGGV